jgi:hypothetical protein
MRWLDATRNLTSKFINSTNSVFMYKTYVFVIRLMEILFYFKQCWEKAQHSLASRQNDFWNKNIVVVLNFPHNYVDGYIVRLSWMFACVFVCKSPWWLQTNVQIKLWIIEYSREKVLYVAFSSRVRRTRLKINDKQALGIYIYRDVCWPNLIRQLCCIIWCLCVCICRVSYRHLVFCSMPVWMIWLRFAYS